MADSPTPLGEARVKRLLALAFRGLGGGSSFLDRRDHHYFGR